MCALLSKVGLDQSSEQEQGLQDKDFSCDASCYDGGRPNTFFYELLYQLRVRIVEG